jgi:uncharacterized membrane protein YkvI
MTVNTTLLSTWLANIAVVVGGGFAVFGDPSLAPIAKEVISGLTPVLIAVLTYSTHSLEATKVKAAANVKTSTPIVTYLPSPTYSTTTTS